MSLEDKTGVLDLISAKQGTKEHREQYRKLHWEGSFAEYLNLVKQNPKVTRNAFQRVYDMITSCGSEKYEDCRKTLIHYKFFDDPFGDGSDAIFGIDIPLMRLVNVFKSAARGYGTEKRVLLLHGPVGSSKSTIVRLLKKGLEHYTHTDEGALYTFEWDAEIDGRKEHMMCPMHEEPLKLVPKELREKVFKNLSNEEFQIPITDESLCPVCKLFSRKLSEQYDGNFLDIIKHVKAKRLLFSEEDRIGIGTFQPKDEKNQDATELSGDTNYRRLAEIGSDSDPRAFTFSGEFQVANRGLIEFIEMLKLDVAFLYDLLGASQEHDIKPKNFAQTPIDEVIIGHTNEAEFRRLEANEFMEALKDRTIKIDIPYNTNWKHELKIYQKDYQEKKVKRHIAPHTLETTSQWAVLTRLEEPKKANLEKIQKMHLYAGKMMPGFTEENVKELRKEAQREGLDGISPRFIQDALSDALVSDKGHGCLNPFILLKEIQRNLKHHTLVNDKQRAYFDGLTKDIEQEYEDTVKNEVQKAISADPQAIDKLFGNYMDNLKACTQKEKVKNKYTGQWEEPNERLMRSIEEKIDIPESRKDEFRGKIMEFVGARAVEGKKFDYKSDEKLLKALELKLFEDQKDTIKLSTLVSNVMDKETQEKIDVVKKRMLEQYGYCDICASDVLEYVASIFARGDSKEK